MYFNVSLIEPEEVKKPVVAPAVPAEKPGLPTKGLYFFSVVSHPEFQTLVFFEMLDSGLFCSV